MKLGKTLRILSAGVLVAAAMISCTEQVDTSARYVFEDETVYSYLSKHPVYSEYVELLGKVKVSPISSSTLALLLSARGHYTVFAPTNDAVQVYLDSLYAKQIMRLVGFYPRGHRLQQHHRWWRRLRPIRDGVFPCPEEPEDIW